jgi:hypothetical protein
VPAGDNAARTAVSDFNGLTAAMSDAAVTRRLPCNGGNPFRARRNRLACMGFSRLAMAGLRTRPDAADVSQTGSIAGSSSI